ncbi:MAG: hypothetical protein V5A47_03815 [Bacteroidales bacterium]
MSTQRDFSLVYQKKLLLNKTYNQLKKHFDDSYTYIREGDHIKRTNYVNFLKNYGKVRFKKMLLKELSEGDFFLTVECPEVESEGTEVQYLSKMQLEILIDVLEINKEHNNKYFDYTEIFDQIQEYLEYTKGKMMKNFNPWNHYKALKKIEERIKKNNSQNPKGNHSE